VVGGDTALYELLIRRYNPYLYKIGRSYHYDHHDTEDLMQESFINAYLALRNFENRASFKTWLTRIMLNNCHSKKKKLSYQKEIAADIVSINSTPMFHPDRNTEKLIVSKELGAILESVLLRLDEDYRIVFTLRELNGLNVAETAEALNITENNVKVRLSRAKQMLRNEIEKIYSPDEIFEFNLVYCDKIVARVMAEITGSRISVVP
jgi:RNA polymerase sigma-70 factor (ECF subfamily)